MIRQTKTAIKELTAQYRSVLKRAFIAGIATVAMTSTGAMAVESEHTVDAAGNYIVENTTRNISAGEFADSHYAYSYMGTDSTTAHSTNLNDGVDLAHFTYATLTDPSVALTNETTDGSLAAYTGTSIAGSEGYEVVSVADATLTAHGELSAYTYSYTYNDVNGDPVNVTGVEYNPNSTAAADISETVVLTNNISGTLTSDSSKNIVDYVSVADAANTITITNGAADHSVSAELFTLTDPAYPENEYTLVKLPDDSLVLQKAGTSEFANITDPSDLKDVYDAVVSAYNASISAVSNAVTNTDRAYTASSASYGKAAAVHEADEGTLTNLTEKYQTYETAVAAYNTAITSDITADSYNQSLVDALDAKASNNTALAEAIAVYESDLTNIKDAQGNVVYATAAQGALADSAVQSVAEGSENGTISVDGTDVAVHGLGSAAYAQTTDFDVAGAASGAETAAKAYADVRDDVVRAEFAAADEELQANINTEANIRAAADIALQDNIDAEALARETADTALQGKIDNEVARASAQEAAIRGEMAAGDALTLTKANAYTDSRVNSLEKNISGGVAAATALSAVNVSNVGKGEVSVGGGYGYYNSQSAVAFGAAMGLSDRWSINAGAGIAQGDKTQFSVRAGTNYKFKLF